MKPPAIATPTKPSLPEVARRIDQVASGAVELFKHAGSFEQEIGVAQAMSDLREMLTDEIMRPIMSLMNTNLGFKTDRDPNQNDYKTGRPHIPYPVHVVRDVVIEGKLRGFHAIGNEFNIIAGGFYAAKAGFRRKLTDGKTFPGLTALKDSYEVPRLVGDKGAIVKCRASWMLNGQPDSTECEFAVKVNAQSGADAILGKAERKLCKRVHDLIAGVNTPDADFDELPAHAIPASPSLLPSMPANDSPPAAELPTSQPPSEAQASPTTPAAGGRSVNYPKAIRDLLKMDGLEEADFLRAMRGAGMDDSLSSLEQVALVDPNRLVHAFNHWKETLAAIAATPTATE